MRKLLLRGNNLIDLSLNNKIKDNIDILARISLLSKENSKLSNLSEEELYEQISLIPDEKIKEYLSSLENSLKTSLPKEEYLIVEISEFFTGLGLEIEEAQGLTKILVNTLFVKNLNDLKNISDENFNDAVTQVNKNFYINHPNFLEKLKVYFYKIY